MTKYHAARLLRLAKILRKVKPEEFDIYKWECGTAACALGHACRDPYFRRLGLSLDNRPLFVTPMFRFKGDRYRGSRAGAKFFGITDNESQKLFLPSGYAGSRPVTPKRVAAKIERLVKRRLAKGAKA
jgi:hypothetical protein